MCKDCKLSLVVFHPTSLWTDLQCDRWSCMLLFMCSITTFISVYRSSRSQKGWWQTTNRIHYDPFLYSRAFFLPRTTRVPDSSHYLITDERRAATPAHTNGETHKHQTGVEKQISVPSVTPERFVIQSLNDIGYTPRGIIYERNFYPTSAREGGCTMHMLARTKPCIVQLSETTFIITATCIREISKGKYGSKQWRG